MSFNRIYDIAGSSMRAQTVRLDTVASNLANSDSVASSEESAFRAIKPVFATLYQRVQESDAFSSAQVQIAGVVQSDRAVPCRSVWSPTIHWRIARGMSMPRMSTRSRRWQT